MINNLSNNTLIAFALLLFSTLTFAADVSGKVISYSCNGCHGTDGLLVKPGMTQLKGQDADKLEQSLLDFKYERKPSSMMGRISKGFTNSELKNVALYFSQLKNED